eukprot:gene18604-25118_t
MNQTMIVLDPEQPNQQVKITVVRYGISYSLPLISSLEQRAAYERAPKQPRHSAGAPMPHPGSGGAPVGGAIWGDDGFGDRRYQEREPLYEHGKRMRPRSPSPPKVPAT